MCSGVKLRNNIGKQSKYLLHFLKINNRVNVEYSLPDIVLAYHQ